MPTLLELQRAMRASLVDRDDGAAAAMLAEDIEADRLDIYRNTFIIGATRALRLSYPAVHKLVGNDFFEGAAGLFIAQHPPRTAHLDDYGAEFAGFLQDFPPAAALVYLADVARLEWAVSCALHAEDAEPLDLARLAGLAADDQGRVAFTPHPAFALLRSDYPVDVIWRAVLDGDDAALSAVDLTPYPIRLMVERRAAGVDVSRLGEPAWRFAAALRDGLPLEAAIAEIPDARADAVLAGHLAAGRFIDFRLEPPDTTVARTSQQEPAL
jgi:Putative DNA-binding domain